MNIVKFKSIQFNVPGLMAGLLIAMPALAVDLKLNSDHSSQSNDLLLTDPLLPNGGSVVTPAEELPQSARDWRYSHSRQVARFSLTAGDQAGGPIRYNTRFPEVKGNPNPASYYHTAPFVGLEFELSLTRGAILIGGLTRRDLWHKGMVGRTVERNDGTWIVHQFNYNDNALVLGWVFGERYQEAPWSADLSLIYDSGMITVNMARAGDHDDLEARTRLIALSMRGRIQFQLLAKNRMALGVGPECHLPLYQSVMSDGDANAQDILADNLKFKASAALGAGLSASFSF